NIWAGLDALRPAGLLTAAQYAALREGYGFLLRVQSRLRIVHNRSLDELPQGAEDVEKLARRLGYEAAAEDTAGGPLLAGLDRHPRPVRATVLPPPGPAPEHAP